MTVPTRSPEVPALDDIDKALSALCTRGLRSWWIIESGGPLLALDCVQAYLPTPSSTDERDYAHALRAYLEHALGDVKSSPHRVILEVVLGLGDEQWKTKEWRSKSAKERRTEAGLRFRENEDPVADGTVRQVYEPRARLELAEIISRDEKLTRGEPVEDIDAPSTRSEPV
jgi:hypothetical protein